jgi:ABC-type polysaccharide/polyol phosphate transport system ATPase subunit
VSVPLIKVSNVWLNYPLLSVNARSLRSTVINRAVGGLLLKSASDVVNIQALADVSFSLDEGDRLGIAGHNGSGKSTLLKVLAGVYTPDRGTVSVRGPVSSFLDLSFGLDFEASGRDNIRTLLRLKGRSRKEMDAMIPEIIEFSELAAYIDLPVRSYSAGMMSRLLFSVATGEPSNILLMDEWLSAGDAHFLEKATVRMQSMFSSARTAVLASHNGYLLHEVCNKLLVLSRGSVVYFGSTKDAPASFD